MIVTQLLIDLRQHKETRMRPRVRYPRPTFVLSTLLLKQPEPPAAGHTSTRDSEEEVIATRELRHRTTIPRRPCPYYSVSLQLRYKATSTLGPVEGLGQTRMMSSQDIIFAPADGLEPGMIAEIAVAWPLLLDGHIGLQLVLETAITGSQDGVAKARILAYDFRTRRLAEAAPKTEAAGLEAPSLCNLPRKESTAQVSIAT
jgi:hypothetical protein